MIRKKIIVALDYDNLDSVINFLDSIDPELCRIKDR
jgi:orotidine-5'-phosphate decarboxylase